MLSVNQVIKNTSLRLAGQNMYYHEKGAFTGQISPLSLIDSHCDYVILGHSEPRRIFGETDDFIREKVLKSCDLGIIPVLCDKYSAAHTPKDHPISIMELYFLVSGKTRASSAE